MLLPSGNEGGNKGSGGEAYPSRTQTRTQQGGKQAEGEGGKTPTGMAYWGVAAGGLLGWGAPAKAATGTAVGGTARAGGNDVWDGEEEANDINWNDTSVMLTASSALLPGAGGAAGRQGAGQKDADAEGILKLIDTIDRLRM